MRNFIFPFIFYLYIIFLSINLFNYVDQKTFSVFNTEMFYIRGKIMKFVKVVNVSGHAKIKLDPEKDTINYFNGTDSLLEFNAETYSVLKAKSTDEDWNIVFGDIHKFLNLNSHEFRVAYADFLQAAHYMIKAALDDSFELDGNKMIQLETDLATILYQFDKDFDIMPKFEDYADHYLPIQSFQGVGERAQDSEEMTFYRDDVVKMSAKGLLSKLICPILGVFVEACKKRMDNTYKEVHAMAIFKQLYDYRYYDLTLKESNFIRNIVKRIIPMAKLNHMFNGYTRESISLHIRSNIYVRRMVAVDLHKTNGNLITYITSCARAAAQTQFSNTGFKVSATEYIKPKDQASEEDGNTSNLEAESRISAKTADFPTIIEAGIRQLLDRFTAEHGLDREVLETSYYYYQNNHITLTPMNSYLMSILFGDYIGGARSLEYVDGPNLIKMVSMLQLYLFNQGYIDLVHLVTARPTGRTKLILNSSDNQLKAAWNSSFEYKNCDDKLTFSLNELKWDTGLKNIIESYTGQIYLTNTSPSIWDLLNDEVQNGHEIIMPESMARSICSIIYDNVISQ